MGGVGQRGLEPVEGERVPRNGDRNAKGQPTTEIRGVGEAGSRTHLTGVETGLGGGWTLEGSTWALGSHQPDPRDAKGLLKHAGRGSMVSSFWVGAEWELLQTSRPKGWRPGCRGVTEMHGSSSRFQGHNCNRM